MLGYRLRSVEAADSAALYDLHRATMQTVVEMVYGAWDDDMQKAFQEKWMQRQTAKVVELDGRLVGVVDIEWRENELYLARIEVAPELQNQGLGSAIIEELIQMGAHRNRAVALDVFDVNPARRLYERLGFRQIGVNSRKIHMRRAQG